MTITFKQSPSYSGQVIRFTGNPAGGGLTARPSVGPTINTFELPSGNLKDAFSGPGLLRHGTYANDSPSGPSPDYPDGFECYFYVDYSGASSAVIKRSSDDAVVCDIFALGYNTPSLSLTSGDGLRAGNPAPPELRYDVFTLGESYYLELNGRVQSAPVTLPDPTPAINSFTVDGYDPELGNVNISYDYTGNRAGAAIRAVGTTGSIDFSGFLTAAVSGGTAHIVSNGTYEMVLNPGRGDEVVSGTVVVDWGSPAIATFHVYNSGESVTPTAVTSSFYYAFAGATTAKIVRGSDGSTALSITPNDGWTGAIVFEEGIPSSSESLDETFTLVLDEGLLGEVTSGPAWGNFVRIASTTKTPDGGGTSGVLQVNFTGPVTSKRPSDSFLNYYAWNLFDGDGASYDVTPVVDGFGQAVGAVSTASVPNGTYRLRIREQLGLTLDFNYWWSNSVAVDFSS